MSDTFSVPPVPAKESIKGVTVQWVNANTVFQRIFQQLHAEERKAIVLRCDDLPLLQGTEEEMQSIFTALLQMILQKKHTVSQLFLHITCRTALQEAVSMTGRMRYIVQFNTNIQPCSNWIHNNQKQTDEIQGMLQQYNGSLQAADFQGCIFSLSLPGKTL